MYTIQQFNPESRLNLTMWNLWISRAHWPFSSVPHALLYCTTEMHGCHCDGDQSRHFLNSELHFYQPKPKI